MATITGLKVSELSNLVVGTTGTLFYVVSGPSNSHKMSERDLYNTLYKLHFSGAFQPISGNSLSVNNIIPNNTVSNALIDVSGGILYNNGTPSINFINNQLLYQNDITVDYQNKILYGDTESIRQNWNLCLFYDRSSNTIADFHNKRLSGVWTITSAIIVPVIYNNNSTQAINIDTSTIYDSLTTESIQWEQRMLYDSAGNTVISYGNKQLYNVGDSDPRLDWQNLILSGNWTAEQLKGIRLIVSGLAPSIPTSPGISGQIAMSGQTLFIATGQNKWGRIPITPWI